MNDIDEAVRAFRDAFENPNLGEAVRLAALTRALDCLALARSSNSLPTAQLSYEDSQIPQARDLYDRACDAFPQLGPYNTSGNVVDVFQALIPTVGDPHDDIADIARELHEFEWRRDNVSRDDAVWHFIFSFDSHWGQHLRHLQMYLFHLKRGV